MSQNSIRMYWTKEEVEGRLRVIMQNIHEQCRQYGKTVSGHIDYVKGANMNCEKNQINFQVFAEQ
jgi:glutamate dehydrogenase (NADP+)